jgi:FtsP/CotA-like multicopper oxidase with cupredoxin domain
VVVSRDGLLDIELTAAPGVVLAGRSTSAYGYNGTSPGPTLRVRPGDLLRVRLVNRLDQPTNLHTHGLHVPPGGDGDNPFVIIDPGARFDYAIAIPADHPPGTHWYHPHHHGTVADQIFAGLVGALLVEGGPDLSVAQDRILLVTDTTIDDAGRVVPPDAAARITGREGDLLLVNGQYQPVVAATSGTSERWRVINACTSRVLAVRLDAHALTQIALDGSYLPAPVSQTRVVLAPGNRADLIVRPTSAGRYALVSEAYDRGRAGMMGSPANPAQEPVTLAILTVSGAKAPQAPLPSSLPAPPTSDGPVVIRRRVTFAMGMGGGMGMGATTFTIDGRTFDPHRDDQTVQLNSIEEWTVLNLSPMVHPFHLHAWPFRVLVVSDGTTPQGTRQDVVLVPAHGWVRLRIPFIDFPGRSVYHCHILDHEDRGMMATVNVRG